MTRKLTMSGDKYRDLLRILKDEIYKYAERQGIDINDDEKLIEACNTMKKIKLGKKNTEILLDGIMHYDVGDQRILKFIDLEGISFAGRRVRDVDFRGTNVDIDPQTVEDKNLVGANFERIDMSGKSFNECIIYRTNLSYTNAKINPQRINEKSLLDSKCDGLDFSNADFTDVRVVGTSFKNAKINLNPQTVCGKSLENTNLENVNMSGKDFSGCNIHYCNLTNTKAVLDLDNLNIDDMWGCKLQGTILLVGEDFDREQLESQYVELGRINKNDYTLTKQKIKTLFKRLNK